MEFKVKIFLILFVFLVIISGCSYKDEKVPQEEEIAVRYYEFLKVNNDLTLSGVKEIKEDDLAEMDYYQFHYNKGQLVKIISHSSLTKSFHELNKYIFNVNKEWREINILSSNSTKEYTFSNDKELIKFLFTYNNQKRPVSFQVIPLISTMIILMS